MFGQTAILLSVALFALIGSLPRLLEKEVAEPECPEPGVGSRPCTVPFLSHNPLTLRCSGALEAEEDTVHWQYANLSRGLGPGRSRRRPGPGAAAGAGPGGPLDVEDGSSPRTFIGPRGARVRRGPLSELSGRAVLRGGVLLVGQARPGDSGLYVCKAGASTLAQYRVDVQDAEKLHVSHRGLGQAPLRNQSVRLHEAAGHRLRLYTRWGPWQECDRCGAPGERKRLGFCWASLQNEEEEDREEEDEVQEEPCGLMQLHLGQALPRRGPEIRYETCRRECGSSGHEELAAQARELLGSSFFLQHGAGKGQGLGQASGGDLRVPPAWLQPHSLLLETLLLDVHEEARLQCPGASVYTPVSWQRDSSPLTRLELLRSPCNGSHQLDQETGGGVYTIAGVRRSDQGVYRCWVRGRRAAAFHLELPEPPPSFHGSASRRHRLQSRRLLGVLRAVIGSFALVFVLSALAELLHSCWCEVL